MTWAEFTAEFNERFFNANLTNEYWRKLKNLQQGSMTVTELMQEFRRLIRLCPNAAASEEDKVRRLLKALRPEIAVLCYEGDKAPDTAEKCFRAALLRESHLTRSSSAATITTARPFQARPSGQGHSRPHQGQNWRSGSNKKRQVPGQQSQGQPNRQGGGAPPNKHLKTPPCATCGRTHLGQCRLGSTACFICGQEGHMRM